MFMPARLTYKNILQKLKIPCFFICFCISFSIGMFEKKLCWKLVGN